MRFYSNNEENQIKESTIKRGRGRPKGVKNKTYRDYEEIKNLADEGYSQTEIARILNKSRATINAFLKYHSIPYQRVMPRRYEGIERLIKEGLTMKKTSDELGVIYGSLAGYISRHPKLKKLYKERK